jgi:AcrR family transcriptional regulator
MTGRSRRDKSASAKSDRPARPADERNREPQQDRSRRTREKLFEAVLKILSEGGKSDLAVTELTRRSGVSVGAFYNLFPDRRVLLLAVFERLRQEALAEIDKAIAQVEAAPSEAIGKVLVLSANDFRQKRGIVFRLMLAHAVEIPELVVGGNRLIEEMSERLAPVVARATRQAIQEAKVTSRLLVRAIVAALDHIELFGEEALGEDGNGRLLAERLVAAAVRGVIG